MGGGGNVTIIGVEGGQGRENTTINWCDSNSNAVFLYCGRDRTKGNGINGSMKRMATLVAMSPLVGTMTADVVAAASAVMTVPTKTWQRQ